MHNACEACIPGNTSSDKDKDEGEMEKHNAKLALAVYTVYYHVPRHVYCSQQEQQLKPACVVDMCPGSFRPEVVLNEGGCCNAYSKYNEQNCGQTK